MEGENTEVVEQTQVPDQRQVEAEARELGWVPKERFRGAPERWTDAQEFLDHGKTYIPHLQSVNRKLSAEMQAIKQQNEDYARRQKLLETSVATLQASVETSVQGDLNAQEADLSEQIKAARKDGDFDTEESLRDKRDAIRQKLREPAKKSVDSSTTTVQTPVANIMESPEFKQFERDNPWFQEDTVMAAASIAVMATLNKTPQAATMSLAQKFAHVETEVKKRFGLNSRPVTSKVEGARNEPGGGGDTSGKSYMDLPSDAKAACDLDGRRVTGPGKRYKTEADWRKAYCKQYFT